MKRIFGVVFVLGGLMLGCSSTDLVKTCNNEICADGTTAYKLCISSSGIVAHYEYFDAAGNSQVTCASSDSDYQTCITNATKKGGPICP